MSHFSTTPFQRGFDSPTDEEGLELHLNEQTHYALKSTLVRNRQAERQIFFSFSRGEAGGGGEQKRTNSQTKPRSTRPCFLARGTALPRDTWHQSPLCRSSCSCYRNSAFKVLEHLYQGGRNQCLLGAKLNYKYKVFFKLVITDENFTLLAHTVQAFLLYIFK